MTTVEGQAWTTARTLDALGRHYGYSDAYLAQLVGPGYSRATVQGRRAGRKALDTRELELFAAAFGIPISVLLLEPVDAIRWVLDNVEGGGIPGSVGRQRSGAGGGLTPYQGDRASIWYTNQPHRARGLLRAVS